MAKEIDNKLNKKITFKTQILKSYKKNIFK